MIWSVVAAALFAIFLAVPMFLGHSASPSSLTSASTIRAGDAVGHGTLATQAATSKWVLPPARLVSLFGTSYSLDTNGVAPIASAIGTPGEIFHSLGDDAVNLAITLVVVLFIAFPANIFNQTLSENYDEVQLMKENARRRIRKTLGLSNDTPKDSTDTTTTPTGSASEGSATTSMPGLASRQWFIATLVIGAVLGGLLDPNFGANSHSFESFLSTLVAFSVGAVLSWFVAKTFRSMHKYPTQTYLKALPIGLGIALACVIVSRASHFTPGYLYGIVVSISFVASMKDQHNSHLIVISTLSTLSVALVAWMLWIPVNHLALTGSGNFIEAILDDVLGSLFIGGIIGSVIGLLPLEGLSGGTLVKWRRDVWAAVFALAVFLLISVELHPASGPAHHGGAPIATAIILFIGFGALSFGTRWYFAQRKLQKPPKPTT